MSENFPRTNIPDGLDAGSIIAHVPPSNELPQKMRTKAPLEFTFEVGGYSSCSFFQKATKLVSALTLLYPDGYIRCQEQNLPTRDAYRAWLSERKMAPQFNADPRAQAHTSSPFVVLNGTFLGGCDDTIAFCRHNFVVDKSVGGVSRAEDTEREVLQAPDGFDKQHTYDYDLIVIGGGSGGCACAEEASLLGARVLLLDYKNPSPRGAAWGLGGTSVNASCIPRHLFHIGSALGETIAVDLPAFGWEFGVESGATRQDERATQAEDERQQMHHHSWSILRDNVQAYTRRLNFELRLKLRDARVTYFNKLGRFWDAHTLDVQGDHGGTGRLTGARFVIAVGDRPQPLDCPGGELAITTDELFSLERAPGETCVVGVGHIAVECADLLRGMGHTVTLAVRSTILQDEEYDRECVEKLEEHLTKARRLRLLQGVVPLSLALEEAGGRKKVRVTFSSGNACVFDTVIVALGRIVDLEALNTDGIGLAVDPENGRLRCQGEQTTQAHIYAIGSVRTGSPEQATCAAQAGKLLARKMFGSSQVGVNDAVIPRRILTLWEYACVGLSEAQARAVVEGKDLKVYRASFTPLEWAIVPERTGPEGTRHGFLKVVVRRSDDCVLGLHYLGPHAGEVIEGFAVAMNGQLCAGNGAGKSLTYAQLVSTTGIHPYSALSVIQSSRLTTLSPGQA